MADEERPFLYKAVIGAALLLAVIAGYRAFRGRISPLFPGSQVQSPLHPAAPAAAPSSPLPTGVSEPIHSVEVVAPMLIHKEGRSSRHQASFKEPPPPLSP